MATPWCDPNLFGAWVGGLGGGLGGTLCGVLGGLTPWLALKGKGRAGLTALAGLLFASGLVGLVVGVVALATGQPYGIWYSLLLCGLMMGVMGGLAAFWLIPRAYRMAAERRKAAEALRAGL